MDVPPMDSSQVIQATPSEISPGVLLVVPPSNPSSQNSPSTVMQEPPSFPNEVSARPSLMPIPHVMPAIQPLVYMPSMDVVKSPPVVRQPPNFIPDFPQACEPFPSPTQIETMSVHTPSSSHSSSVSPPQSHIPSPPIHTMPAPFVGVSSLASALDPVTVPEPHPPPNIPFPPDVSMTQPLTIPAVDADDSVKQEDRTSPPLNLLETVLDNIVAAASTTKRAFQNNQVMQAKDGVNRLQSDISVVTQLMSGLVSQLRSLGIDDATAFSVPAHSASAMNAFEQIDIDHDISIDQEQLLPPFAPSDRAGQLHVLDSSRKRCASAVEEERIKKALKREPIECSLVNPAQDVPAIVPPSGLPLTPPVVVAPSIPISPPSEPPTPPAAVFKPVVPLSSQAGFPFNHPPQHLDYNASNVSPVVAVPPVTPPSFPPSRTAWSETISIPRHRHSLSTGSLSGDAPMPIETSLPVPLHTPPLTTTASSVASAPFGRMSRSGSISGTYASPFGFTYVEHLEPTVPLWPEIARGAGPVSAPTPLSSWYGHQEMSEPSVSASSAPSTRASPEDDDDDDDEDTDDGSPARRNPQLPSDHANGHQNGGSDIPQEYRSEVDRIFFEYLNKICSNLDATDSKGEPIHQTLMAKKMQRLDESPDFRPFKFRIQAFTHGFLDELSRQGYPEEKIPMKKVRNYLWKQQYILRFNEDGKKAKSKGNHIWNIEARKTGDGQWEFRPFHRKIAGSPPTVAYCGLKWSWTPRVWDPQASFANVTVQYSSPNLPPWLSWKEDVLSGVPPADAQSSEITIIAKYIVDGQEGQLSTNFLLNIAPVSSIETSFSQSRRSSIGTDNHTARRSTSDSVLPAAAQRPSRSVPGPEASQGAQVIKVLTTAAQRVAHERQSQLVFSNPVESGEIQDLVKQQHVLTRTASACDKEISGQPQPPNGDIHALAVAAQSLVMTAAETVLADRTYASGAPEAVEKNNITVNEVSAKTQDAVAQAVKLHGSQSTEVDIMKTATSILKEARAPVSHPGMLNTFPNTVHPHAMDV